LPPPPAPAPPPPPPTLPPVRHRPTPQFMSLLSNDDLLTWRGRAINTFYWAATHTLVALLDIAGSRGMAPLRRAQALSLGSPQAGRSCRPLVRLDASSWLLEPPRPLGPPDVRLGRWGEGQRRRGGRAPCLGLQQWLHALWSTLHPRQALATQHHRSRASLSFSFVPALLAHATFPSVLSK
jgi:hypothetical protein